MRNLAGSPDRNELQTKLDSFIKKIRIWKFRFRNMKEKIKQR